mgnify:CR=1 FL=1
MEDAVAHEVVKSPKSSKQGAGIQRKKVRRQAEEEEAAQTKRIQKMEEEEPQAKRIQKMEEEEPQAKRIQKMEEEEPQAKRIQKMEEEEPQAKRIHRKEQHNSPLPNIQLKRKNNQRGKTMHHLEKMITESKGKGFAMPDELKSHMENKFGADFSNVRIHTDNQAIKMTQMLHAHAFTHGNDIYFNEGRFNPESDKGKELIAHELTHVVQQKGS